MRDLNRFLKRKFFVVFTVIYTIVFIIVNVVFYVTNTVYLEDTVERENDSLVEMMEHLIRYTDEESALVFLEHYGHTHNVYLDYESLETDAAYETAEPPENAAEYDIVVNGGTYARLSVDNDQSSLIDTHASYMFIYNIILVVVYGLGLALFSVYFKKQYRIVVEDMQTIHEKIAGLKSEEGYHFENIAEIADAFDEKIRRIERLQESHKAHIRSLSHDIKTPLTILKSTLQGFESGRIDVSEDTLKSLMEEIDTIDALVPKLMQASKEDAKENRNVSFIVRQSIERHAPLLKTQGIKVSEDIEDEVYMHTEKGMIERLMDHLLSNVREYAGADAMVYVELKSGPVTLVVEDDGEGMDEKTREHAFDVSKEARGLKKGSGIGLSIVKDIVDAHGGSVAVESETGKGTRILVRFPS